MHTPDPIPQGVQLTSVYIPDAAGDATLLSDHGRRLMPEERAQCARFLFERDRLRCMLTRVALREVLSWHAPVAPAEWRFGVNPWGKPFITNAGWQDDLSFNVTHTDRMILIGVTRRQALGVDVERLTDEAPVEVAERFFSAAESGALHTLPPHRRSHRFFELWTLKEAYIKAVGRGLSIPLDSFSFDLDRDPRGLTFDAGPGESSRRWHFCQVDVGHGHVAALCVEAAAPVLPILETWSLLPGVGRSPARMTVTRSSTS